MLRTTTMNIHMCNQLTSFLELGEEQKNNLNKYMELLLEWNKKMNLIGKSTEEDIWNRHILDSIQLMKLVGDREKTEACCADFGTGAGIPGLVLSIVGIKNMTLVEKSPKKCSFLENVKNNLALEASEQKLRILNTNIGDMKPEAFDIIFSRALAPLVDLLAMVYPFLKPSTRCIFLKGKKLQEELVVAKKSFDFRCEVMVSITSDEGGICNIRNIKIR